MNKTSNWKTVKLGSICSFKYGEMPKKGDLAQSGYPVFSGYRIVGNAHRFHYERPEIIVVARGVGGTGDIKMSPAYCFLTNLSIAILINAEHVHKKFLYYHLVSTSLWSLRTGSAQAQITIERLRQHEVRIPPTAVQTRIASILSAYDDLIENNTQRIAILEEMARRIFEEWFVHFRAPGCEGLPMVDSPLGPIPKGWEVKRLDALINFDPNGRVPDGIKPFVPMTSLSTTSMIVGEIERRDTRSGSKFGQGDTLLARITPCLENGKTGFVDFLNQGETGVGSTEFVVMRGRSVPPTFVQLLARSEAFRAHAIKSMSGATGRQRVRRESLEQFEIAAPPQAVAQRFNANVSPIFKLARILADQNANLRAQRDLLLPKLISGEIDVTGSVAALPEAAE